MPEDDEEAIKWSRKAVEQGDRGAQNMLGVCYENGIQVSQDYEEAAKWYEKAGNEEKKISVLKKVRR